jgi:hypothetical protein
METATPPTAVDQALFVEAYERLLPEFRALAADEVAPVNVDVTSAVASTLGVIGELRSHREDVAKLPRFDVEKFDKIEQYAMALSHAQGLHATAQKPPDDFRDLYDEAARVRDVLHVDVTALIGRGMVRADALKDYKGLNGYKNLAADLQILAIVIKDNWPRVQGKCATQKAELDHAFVLMERLMRAVGYREQTGASVVEAADLRARAFTLFTRAYDEARRAMIYLRWHDGDADDVVPSLYVRSPRRKTREDDVDATSASTPTPAEATAPAAPPASPKAAAIGSMGPFAQ